MANRHVKLKRQNLLVLRSVTAQLYSRPVCSVVETGLGHFEWVLLVPDCLLQVFQILLLVFDLFHHLRQQSRIESFMLRN